MNKVYAVIPLATAVGFLIFPFIVYFGNDLMIVTSDSMIPTLMPHDLLIVQKTSINNIQVDDIIAFDTHVEGFGVVVHRTINKVDDGGGIGFNTKGDNVSEPDTWIVHDDDFIGKVIDVVPTFGILLVDPVRYSLAAVIIITCISLIKEITSEAKIQKKK